MKAKLDDRVMAFLTWGTIAMVAITPLPLASNRALPVILIVIAAALLALVAMMPTLLKDKRRLRRLRLPVLPTTLFVVVLAYIAIQGLLPLPFSLAHPLWAKAAAALGEPNLQAYLSIDPISTIERLPLLIAYGFLFIVSYLAARRFDRLYLLTIAVLISGGVWLGLSFADFVINADQRLLGDPRAYPGVPTGPFVNRNSFATYAGMIGTGGLVLVIWTLQGSANTTYKGRRAIADTLNDQSLPILFGLVLFVAGISLVIMTESRAGFSATMLAVAIVVLLAGTTRRPTDVRGVKRSLWLLLLIALLALGWIFMLFRLSGEGLDTRFTLLDDDLRWSIFQHILTIIEQRPIWGTGYDTFEAAYAMTRGAEQLWQPPRIDHAHSTYLELAVEIGVPATIALVLAPCLLALKAIGAARKGGRAAMAPAMAVAWTVLLGMHTAVDFSAEMPAIAVLYAIILGMASGAGRVLENRR
ncbi:MAG: O-antigen ligase family protein [Alphaproteobacteria bacterium]